MLALYDLIIFRPILNLLVWFYNIIPGNDIGLAIIAMTCVIFIILYPFKISQIKQQRALQAIQPKIDEIRKRLKDDKEGQAKELMELYKKDKVNPAASCLPLLVQLPVMIGLFQVLRSVLAAKSLNLLYTVVANPGIVNNMFLGIADLSKPNYVLAILAGGAQFWQSKQMMAKKGVVTPVPVEVAGSKPAEDESMSTMINSQMMYMMPVVTVFIGFSLPGGLALYWLVMSLLTVAQQGYLMSKPVPPVQTPQL